ncbi:putative flavoprotein [Spongiibacter sp. IMCC21906]|uniref:NADPH-dependent FMN reductase n=1 Tax=Spongiibacter sp. IMCC21906 TaxID=1620392 RepID=UPI00062DE6B6|nr:NADPH-dependent FMN reductase [Spongiibacter sp. IMCC21906]AKH68220.1 putative flavoprotein [Spongiibacter sp. IMCC21906]
MKLLLMSGSFHSGSKSLAILNALQGYFPEQDFELPKLDALPFYNEDLSANLPVSVVALIQSIKSADGIVVCSPEYNHSIPAVIKNAIDWASRPAFTSVLKDKPISIITQANSPVGGARAQAHFKLVFDSTLSIIQPCHEMMVTDVSKAINAQHQVVDEHVAMRLQRHLSEFIDFIARKNLGHL